VGQTPLHIACLRDHAAAVSWLLKHGATQTPNPRRWGQLPIHICAVKGHMASAQVLLAEQLSSVDALVDNATGPRSVPGLAAYNKRFEFATMLGQYRPLSRGELVAALRMLPSTELSLVPALLKASVGVNLVDLVRCPAEVFREIVEVQSQPPGPAVLLSATTAKNRPVVRYLLEEWLPTDKREWGQWPLAQTLLYAVRDEAPELVRLLPGVQSEAAVAAAGTASLETLKAVLNLDQPLAGVGVPYSALHNATLVGLRDNVVCLLAKGAPVNDVSGYGSTPLECACNTNNVEIARLLLAAKASPRTANRKLFMKTPLHIAAANGSTELCALLLSAGADINAVSRGSTALDMALDSGLPGVAELLRAHGGTQRARKAGGQFKMMDYQARAAVGRAEPPPPVEAASVSHPPLPQWKTVRLFISSTFTDMPAERDVLVRLVLPRLRRECEQRRLHLLEVDLRWGITEEEAQAGQTLARCLAEVQRADLFVAFLGQRYGWVPPGGSLSVTELEINRFLSTKRPALFLQRAGVSYPPALTARYCDAGADKVQALARRLGAIKYAASVKGEGLALPDLEALLYSHLSPLLAAIAPAVQLDEAARERHYHQLMLEQRAADFVGREALVDEIVSAIHSSERTPILLVAESGAGKSALMAHVAKRVAEEAAVLPHFVGASSQSVDVARLVARLADELRLEADVDNFAQVIQQARPTRRTVIFIDALNQLTESHNAHDMRWVPRELPSDVTLVLSSVPGPLTSRLHGCRTVPVRSLSADEAGEVVAGLLSRHGKQLTSEQTGALLRKSTLPLYLRTAAEALRMFGDFESLSTKIESLAPTPAGLLEQVVAWVEAGVPAARRALALIECSPGGLPEAVAAELVPGWGTVLAAIAHLLRPLEQEPVLDFFHRLLSKVVRARYLASPEQRAAYHSELADFYLAKPDRYLPRIKNLTHHLKAAGREPSPLLSFEAMALKIEAGLAHELVADFADCQLEAARPYHAWLLRHISILAAQPQLARQTALNAGLISSTEARPLLRLQQLLPAHSALSALTCPSEVNVAVWSGGQLIVGLMSGQLQYWAADSGHLLAQVQAHATRITALSTSSNQLASLGADGSVIVWADQTATQRLAVPIPPGAEALAMVWIGPGLLAVGTSDGLVHVVGGSIWQISAGGPVEALAYQQGTLAFSADKSIALYDLDTRQTVATLVGHSKPVKAICWFNGRWHSGGQDKQLLVWPRGRGTLRPENTVSLWSDSVVALAASTISLAVGSWDKSLQVLDNTYQPLQVALAHSHFLRTVAYSADGRRLASGGVDMTVLVWDANNVSGGGGLHHSKIIRGLAWAGGILASGSWDRTAKIWAPGLQARHTLSGHAKRINTCSLSADGKSLVTGSADKTALLWDTATGHRLSQYRCPAPVLSTALSAEGRYTLTGDAGGTIRIWEKGEEIGVLTGHHGWVSALAFSPDSRSFASGDTSGSIRLWDSSKGESVESYPGHTKPILALAFSADGRYLATASEDRTGRIWDVQAGRQLALLRGHKHELTGVVFLDSQTVATSRYCVTHSQFRLLHSALGPRRPRPPLGLSSDCSRQSSGGRLKPLARWRLYG
jgi:WD40 repeat protein